MDNWAIVIGVDHYDAPEARLKGAVNDALAMRRWLLDPSGGAVPERQLALLLSPALNRSLGDIRAIPATRDNVIASIDRVLSRSGRIGDRFFFYFSGHGLLADITAVNQSGMAFSDFGSPFFDKSLTASSLFEEFKKTQFKEQFFFIDGCRNAPFKVKHQLGVYPDNSRELTDPVSPQFCLYGTALLRKAVEVGERGAFTEVLLEGLAGKGSAKRWSQNEGAYVVRWDSLSRYVCDSIKARNLSVNGDGGSQWPSRFGDDCGEDPVLGRIPEEAFAAGERLSVRLTPEEALEDCSVVVQNYADSPTKKPKPIKASPVHFDRLPPRSYVVDVEADGWRLVGRKRAVELYEPTEVSLELERLPPVDPPELPADRIVPFDLKAAMITFAQKSAVGAIRFLKTYNSKKSAIEIPELADGSASLTVGSRDRLASVEIADDTGQVHLAGRGSVRLAPCPVGFYRARLVSPEGELTEQLVSIGAGERPTIELAAPPSASPLVQRLINKCDFTREPDGTVSVSASVGPSASLRLSTVLALAAAAPSKSDSDDSDRLRAIGIASFAAETDVKSGVQIVIGSDENALGDAGWTGRQRVSVAALGDDTPPPFTPLESSPHEAAIAGAAFARAPGPCLLRLQDTAQTDQPGLELPLVVLPNRTTLLVITRDSEGRISTHLYMPARDGPESLGKWLDALFPESSFAAVRRIELMQRAAANGRVNPTLPEIQLLLDDRWRDPVAGCLGAYLTLRRGNVTDLEVASSNLVKFFGRLPDAHVLRGTVLERSGKDGAAFYAAALDQGIPIFRDGVALLAAAAERVGMRHARLPLLQALAARPAADPIWSATMI